MVKCQLTNKHVLQDPTTKSSKIQSSQDPATQNSKKQLFQDPATKSSKNQSFQDHNVNVKDVQDIISLKIAVPQS